MKFCELSETAKWKATIQFNSEFDAYGINGTKDAAPCDVEEMEDISESNGWEFDETGNRINLCR